jgi:hypothetical protein
LSSVASTASRELRRRVSNSLQLAVEPLLLVLAVDAEIGHRTGSQTFQSDLFPTALAFAVAAPLDSVEGSLDLDEELALPHPPGEREARLRDGVVDLVGKVVAVDVDLSSP